MAGPFCFSLFRESLLLFRWRDLVAFHRRTPERPKDVLITFAEDGSSFNHALHEFFQVGLLADGLIHPCPGMTDCATCFDGALKLVIVWQPMRVMHGPGNCHHRYGQQQQANQQCQSAISAIHAHKYQYPFHGPCPSCGHTPIQ